MRILLVFASILALLPVQNLKSDPDLIVVKFNYGKQQTGDRMIRSVQEPDPPMNEPIRLDLPKKDEPQEIKNRRDMQERRAEMQAVEINAARSSQKGATIYFYHLEVKNTSNKVVKGFAWEYQPGELPDPSDRQFFCVVKAKPSESKTFDLFTPLAPSRVVNVSDAADKSDNKVTGSIVINKVEYTDGSVWKRPAWNPKTFAPENTEKVAVGKCIGL